MFPSRICARFKTNVTNVLEYIFVHKRLELFVQVIDKRKDKVSKETEGCLGKETPERQRHRLFVLRCRCNLCTPPGKHIFHLPNGRVKPQVSQAKMCTKINMFSTIACLGFSFGLLVSIQAHASDE